MAVIRVQEPKVASRRVVVSSSLDGVALQDLWYEIRSDTKAKFEPLDSGFALLALLPLAMSLGADVRMYSPIDRDTLANIEEWQDFWLRLEPDLYSRARLQVEPAVRTKSPRGRSGSVLAFSGGVDACYSLAAHCTSELGFRSKRIGLAVAVHGFGDLPQSETEAFEVAFERMRPVTEAFDVPLCAVATNWFNFCPDWESTHMIALTSLLHLFSKRFESAVVSSGNPYLEEQPTVGTSSSTDHLLGNHRFPVQTTGFNLNRTGKAAYLAKFPVVTDHVRVCYQKSGVGRNCGACLKCVRTALSFIAVGVPEPGALPHPTPERIDGVELRDAHEVGLFAEALSAKPGLPPEMASQVVTKVRREAERLGVPSPIP